MVAPAPDRPASPPRRLLVIEDEAAVRRTIVRVLEEAGYAAVGVSDGARALELLREGTRFDAIMLDVSMPEMNGYQFRVRQLADPELASIPVIVLSGEASRPMARRLLAAGFVTKPFLRGELVAAIESAVGGEQVDLRATRS